MPTVAVIGSGLSAIGAIKALIKLGFKPTVLDSGETLDDGRTDMVRSLACRRPDEWTSPERMALSENHTLKSSDAIPKKLVFGSDYFYGKQRSDAPLESDGNPPPFSYALGGLSAGWGAAVLPPQACDLVDWPVGADELNDYCGKVLADLPYSAREDELSINFPLLKQCNAALRISRASTQLLDAFKAVNLAQKDDVVFGQARLLVNAATDDLKSCKYCGQCMSGCVYGSIYKAGDEIISLQKKGEIEYLSDCLIDKLSEVADKVVVTYFDAGGRSCTRVFDRVFLAAGAVNSTRVVLNSLGYFDQEVQLKTRGGLVVPVFSLRKLKIDWPVCNTQPSLFLEIKGNKLEHWVHVQVSTDNELLLQKLGMQNWTKGLASHIKRFVASRILIIFVNYHSDHAGHYKLWLTRSDRPLIANTLHSKHRPLFPQFRILWTSCLKLLTVFSKIGCLPLFPFAKLNSGSYHVGGTLPMKIKPSGNLETDLLGRVGSWQQIHVVDSSVFPSLPGTTIGLLTMANAYRIVDKVNWSATKGG